MKTRHKHELINNPDHPFFHQTAKTKEAWNQIAEDIDSKPQKCRMHWSLLHDYYRKLKKKINAKGGLNNYHMEWELFDAMSFIDKYDGVKINASYSHDNNLDDFADEVPIYEEISEDASNGVNMESTDFSEADSAISQSTNKCSTSDNNAGQQEADMESSSSHFFALLGAKIDEIECPPKVRYNLEKNITDLVYDLLETCSNMSD